jgi:uncharacterized membrane-anchored protein YhcB (DUF1043 family)
MLVYNRLQEAEIKEQQKIQREAPRNQPSFQEIHKYISKRFQVIPPALF